MNYSETLDDNYSTDFKIKDEIKSYLRESAKWAKFLAILGFIASAFLILGALSAGFFMSAAFSELDNSAIPFSSGLISVFYLLIAGIYFMPVLYLYRFATNTQAALNSNNQIALTTAFKNMKSLYKFMGIAAILFLGFYGLIIVLTLLGGMGSMLF